jgi:cell division protein FtsW
MLGNRPGQEKGENRKRGRQVLPLIGRSPALDALDQRHGIARNARASRTGGRRISYAAEERPAARVRKNLPPRNAVGALGLNSSLHSRARSMRTGITAGWRRQVLPESEEAVQPLQPISEEEQKKLAELEMQLPRVAGPIDPWLLIIVLALLCIGLVMVYSASSFVSAQLYGDASYFFERQLLWTIIGIPVMLIAMRIDYRVWRRFSLIGMIIVLPLLILVLTHFGSSAYGASRWLGVGSFFSFQPSELAKLVLALYIADWLARKGRQVGTFLYGLAPFIIMIGIILGLVLLENDMGTTIIIAGFAVAMFFTAGANIVQFLLAMACGGVVLLTQAFKPYRYARLVGFMNPFAHITNLNLQLYQSLLAFGSGGLFGVGLGQSRQKTGWLPFPYTDSIFAIIGEELGYVGCVLVIMLFVFLAFRGFRLARRTQDVYGALLATGITTWLVLQAMINIGASTGSIPYTGVPLPFISFGGSSLVISMAAVGVLLNISRYIQEPENPALSRRTMTMAFKRKKVT